MKPSRLLIFAVFAIFPVAALAESQSPTVAPESAGALCDKLAGHADDPDFDGDGVAFDDIDAKAAEPACRDAIAAHPEERRYLFQLARVLRKAENTAAALAAYQQAADKGSTIAIVGIGLLYEDGDGVPQDYAKAAEHYRKAMDAGSVVAIGNLAYLYDIGELGENGAAEAFKLYKKQIAAGDTYALIELGNLYQWGRGTAKDEAKAEELFRRAIADKDPDTSATGKNALAWLFATANRNLPEAEALAAAAVAAYPEEPAYIDTLAWVKHRLGRDAEAVIDAEKSVALDAEGAGSFDRLGDILAALGETAKAKAAWQKALDLAPPTPYEEAGWHADAIRKKIAAVP